VTTDARIISVTATNDYVGKNDYRATNLMDPSFLNAWNTKGNGVGESVTFYLAEKSMVYNFRVVNGYSKSSEVYYNNNRVYSCTLYFDDGGSETFYLNDYFASYQYFTLNQRHITSTVTLRINSVYHGTTYEDTCLTYLDFNY
ncbi:MAG: NADase-type glycan-binding domain-containing protein, partial [bacterium]